MKCKKLTYLSPLHGSVQCEDLIEESYGREEFDSEGVFALYNRNYCVEEFLGSCVEDLVQYVPDTLKKLVLKAVFGKYSIIDGSIFLATEIYVKREPNTEEGTLLGEWITAQLSDGWGEALEQNAVFEESITVSTKTFNATECEFEEDCYDTTAFYYIHPWTSLDWSLELGEIEEVDVYIPYQEPIVHSAYCKLNDRGEYITTTVYKAPNSESAFQCMKNSGAFYDTDMLRLVEEKGSIGDCEIFIVLAHTGLFSQFLPIVGMMNETKARLFELDAESGEIDIQDYDNGNYEGFYKKLTFLIQ